MPTENTPPAQQPAANNNKDYAIVIGINDYMELTPLNGPLNDAQLFKDWLLDANGGNLPPRNCHFIPSDPTPKPFRPLQDDIDAALDVIFTDGSANGFRRLYFYFSGHGFGAKWDINGLCLPKWSNRFRNAALSSKSYFDLIVESDLFEDVFLFFDCCRDRKINAIPTQPMLGWPRPGGGTTMALALFASEFENPAFEAASVTGGNALITGHFTRALLAGLQGGATNGKGEITIESLVNFVKKGTEDRAKSSNQRQSADFFFKGSPAKLFNPVIFKRPVQTTELTLRFKTDGDYTLVDPALDPVRQGSAAAGDTWVLPLTKGVYTIADANAGREEYIVINVSAQAQTKNYDF